MTPSLDRRPRTSPQGKAVLTIAGFDPSSGAGFTADLKVFAAHGLYGLACPTALTVQSTRGVRRSDPVDAALIAEILDCLAEDISLEGVKIGMLASRPAVTAVARALQAYQKKTPNLPVVLDPVLRSSSGAVLLPPDALDALRSELLPLVSVLTPNPAEAAVLSGGSVRTRAEIEAAAQKILPMLRGGGAVVLTGGDLESDEVVEDYLLTAGAPGRRFAGPRVHTAATHGTGCAFSSALLAGLVRALPLPEAVRSAKIYVSQAMRHAYPIGRGRGPMHHLFALDLRKELAQHDGTAPEPSKWE